VESAFKILVVDDDPQLLFANVRILKSAGYEVITAANGKEALAKAKSNSPDLVLSDVAMPDMSGTDVCRTIKNDKDLTGIYVILISGFQKKSAQQAEGFESGADGYIVRPIEKREFLARIASVVRIVKTEKELRQREEEIRALSMTDPLTGLYNRRGFFTLADQQLKMARRAKQSLLFIYMDLDGMKTINDFWGHHKGDEALVETAQILRKVFRDSDIIARLGGDEFVTLALDASEDHSTIISDRLKQQLDIHNSRQGRDYNISISVGMAYNDDDNNISIDELLARADTLMYEQKKDKRGK